MVARPRPVNVAPWLLVAVLVSVAAVWWLVPVVPEGPVLFSVTPNHGLVVRDLPGLLALGTAAAVAARTTKHRRRRPAPSA